MATLGCTRLPDDAAVDALQHAAHERCDIAHSICGDVRVQGRWQAAR